MKKLVSVMLAVLLMVSSLAGCSDTEKEESKQQSNSVNSTAESVQESSKEEEANSGVELLDPIENTDGKLVLPRSSYVEYPVEDSDVVLDYWATLHNNVANNPDTPTANETAWAQYWQEETGIKVQFRHPTSGSESAEFGVLVVSGSLPDIIEWKWAAYTGGVTAAIEEGVIIYLDEYIASDREAADLWQFLQDNPTVDRQIKTDEGHYYCFPFVRGDEILQTTSGIFLRGDMLAEENLEVPETIADWTQVLTAFKERGCTAPFIASGVGGVTSAFLGAFGVRSGMYIEQGTTEVHYGPYEDGYRNWLIQMNEWYKAGLLDPDLQTSDGTTQKNAILMGEAGATFGSGGGNMGTWWATAEMDPDTYGEGFEFVGAKFPVLNEGDVNHYSGGQLEYATGSAGSGGISADCEYPEIAVKFLNYLYSEKGHRTINFGREGISYTMVDDTPKYTDLVMKNDTMTVSVAMSYYSRGNTNGPFVQDPGYILQYYERDAQVEALYLWSEGDNVKQTIIPAISLTTEESSEYAALTTQMSTLVSEMQIRFIIGETDPTDDAQWNSFKAQLEQSGVARAIEIQQAAVDRYNSR